MNLNQLRYFVTVAEHRSFTKAAAQHYISQTAITQQIHALEEKVGATLIDRNSRPISLTPAGSVFLQETRAILERMDSALRRTREALAEPAGELRVGYVKGGERSGATRLLREFRERYPSIHLTCFRSDGDALIADLKAGECDIAFVWDGADVREADELLLRSVERTQLLLALHDGHPLVRRERVARSDLKAGELLTEGQADDVESALMMVSAGEGAAIVSAYWADGLPGMDNIRFIPMEGESVELVAAWRRDGQNPALKRFVERLW